ncbi:MAG: hypothetical protein JO304_20815 [Solirubrobacterales bacterium]|nr:hypothetical protein [Solirubrobacterales bacterium]
MAAEAIALRRRPVVFAPMLELGHRSGRAKDLNAVRGGRVRQRVRRQVVERRDFFDKLFEAGGG